MKQSKLLIALVAGMLVFSQGTIAKDPGGDNWNVSGWINEGVTYYDYAGVSDAVQGSDNGTTLGSRIALEGSADLPLGLTAGFQVILEPSSTSSLLGLGSGDGFDDNSNDHDIGVLGNNLHIIGSFGKLTIGKQSMPTTNIAVLEDPSLTFWSSNASVLRGNGVTSGSTTEALPSPPSLSRPSPPPPSRIALSGGPDISVGSDGMVMITGIPTATPGFSATNTPSQNFQAYTTAYTTAFNGVLSRLIPISFTPSPPPLVGLSRDNAGSISNRTESTARLNILIAAGAPAAAIQTRAAIILPTVVSALPNATALEQGDLAFALAIATDTELRAFFGSETTLLAGVTTEVTAAEDAHSTFQTELSTFLAASSTSSTDLSTFAAALSTATALSFGSFMSCMATEGLKDGGGIGIDCNGRYRSGVRYDLPAFGPVNVALGYANDDVYDIAAKYKGNYFDSINAQLALGYTLNRGLISDNSAYRASASSTFQTQIGLMHPDTGIFGTVAYQREEANETRNTGTHALSGGQYQDKTNAWWVKTGLKRRLNRFGDTVFAFQYGQYIDQYGHRIAELGVTGSKVERIGFEINQYFGNHLIIYGTWEQLGLGVECSNTNPTIGFICNQINLEDVNTFTTGLTYFF